MNAQVVHAMPGRIRLVVPEMKRNQRRADDLCQQLGDGVAVRHVAANPVIGSLLLTYAPSQEDRVFARLREVFPALGPDELRNHLGGSRDGRRASANLAGKVTGVFREMNRAVEEHTGAIDLKLLVPLLLIALAAGSLLLSAMRRKSVLMPSWYDLIWFAFNTFIILNLPLSRPDEA